MVGLTKDGDDLSERQSDRARGSQEQAGGDRAGEHRSRASLLRADRAVPYGDVVGVIGSHRQEAGIDKLGMVTEPAPDAASTSRGERRR